MKTDDLIQKLAADLKPVRSMASPLRMTVLFFIIGLGLIALSFIVMSSRIDLRDEIKSPKFLFEVGISLILALSALSLSTFLSRPGRTNEARWLERVTLALLALVLVYDGLKVFQLSADQIFHGLNLAGIECFLAVSGFSVALGAAMIFWLRKGASVNPRLSGLVIATACVAFANVSIVFFCGSDNGMHILMWHFALPMFVAIGGGLIASRFSLKW